MRMFLSLRRRLVCAIVRLLRGVTALGGLGGVLSAAGLFTLGAGGPAALHSRFSRLYSEVLSSSSSAGGRDSVPSPFPFPSCSPEPSGFPQGSFGGLGRGLAGPGVGPFDQGGSNQSNNYTFNLNNNRNNEDSACPPVLRPVGPPPWGALRWLVILLRPCCSPMAGSPLFRGMGSRWRLLRTRRPSSSWFGAFWA